MTYHSNIPEYIQYNYGDDETHDNIYYNSILNRKVGGYNFCFYLGHVVFTTPRDRPLLYQMGDVLSNTSSQNYF